MFRSLLFLLSLILIAACGNKKLTSTPTAKANHRIAFYNVENLFDIYDDPGKEDEEFMPNSKKKWTEERYQKKINDLSQVFAALEFPSLIGVCEVENERVLKDLSQSSTMQTHQYGFVHFESPDHRGIDNALLFKKADFKVSDSKHYPIDFPKGIVEEDYTTRDILHVKGLFAGQHTLHVFVNHWPSRRGGLKASEPKRLFVAKILKQKIQQVLQDDAEAKIIIMGDFNDEPDNNSIAKTLGAQDPAKTKQTSAQQLYNCSSKLDQLGEGTYNYRGNWNMLDQFIVSGALLNKEASLQAGPVNIFKAEWLIYNDKKYGPKPNKTYGGPNYYGGYSDHYPIMMELMVK